MDTAATRATDEVRDVAGLEVDADLAWGDSDNPFDRGHGIGPAHDVCRKAGNGVVARKTRQQTRAGDISARSPHTTSGNGAPLAIFLL